MKTIVVLFVLLVPSVAWCAQEGVWPDEPCTNGDLFIDTVSKSYVVCEHEHWHLLRPACETDMEAAMRAMDEFVPTREELGYITGTFDILTNQICGDLCREARAITEAEQHLARVKREQAAITQWATVKQACWAASTR